MTIRHLRIFVTVCQCGSITEAARRLYIAQPSVSLAVGELEKHYKTQLFDRISRRLQITDAGRRLYEYAAGIVALYGEMEDRMGDESLGGRLSVGATITIGNRLLPGLALRFKQGNPAAALRVRVDNSDRIENLVLDGELDIGLIEGVAHQPQLRAEAFLDDGLALLCGRSHPLWEKRWVSPEELAGYDFILREKGSGTRELFDSALLTRELALEPVWESISTHAIIVAVAEGLGVTVLPWRLAESDLAGGRLRRVPIKGMDLERKFYIITHKNKYLTGEALAFMELARQAGDYIPPVPSDTGVPSGGRPAAVDGKTAG